MALLVVNQRIGLPVGDLAKRLTQTLPGVSWRIGDGPQEGLDPLDRPTSIIGRTGNGEMILMGVTLHPKPLPLEAGAPPHQAHLELAGPSVEDPELANRILLAVATSILSSAGRGHLQLRPGGRWYDASTCERGMAACLTQPLHALSATQFFDAHGTAAADAGAAGAPPPVTQGRPRTPADDMLLDSDLKHSFAKILTDIGGAEMATQMGYQAPPTYAEEEPRADRLPTFVIALEHPLTFDWGPLMDIGEMDKDGGWRVEPGENGTGALHGRGSTVIIAADSAPIPDYILSNARARSFWYTDKAALNRRTSSLTVTCDLDTRAAPFEDVRETAKIISLLLGVLTRAPGALALLNNGIHTLMPPAMVQSQVGHLHKNQVPLMLWTWTAPDSMERDNVSLTTGGVLPFLGYEVEVWNAPGDPQVVGDQLGKILNYLLHVGPMVKDGEYFSEQEGDRSIRGFFGKTRAQRFDREVPVLFLEFDNPAGGERPRADPAPEPSAQAPANAAGPPPNDLLVLVARTRMTSYPGNIILEQLDRNFPDYRWTSEPGAAGNFHTITGEGAAGQVTALVTAHAMAIARKLHPPRHRFLLDVAVGTGGDQALARRVGLVIACCNIIQIDPEGHFQLGYGGNWLSHDDALTGVSLPCHTKDIADFDLHFGTPPARFSGIDPYLSDSFSPMPDVLADCYQSMVVARGAGPAGMALKSQMAQATPEPRRGLFGRPLFGRKK